MLFFYEVFNFKNIELNIKFIVCTKKNYVIYKIFEIIYDL